MTKDTFCERCGRKHSYQEPYRCRKCGQVLCSVQIIASDGRWMYCHAVGIKGQRCGPVWPATRIPVA